MPEVGIGTVSILPDFKEFGRRLTSQIEPKLKAVAGDIAIRPDTSDFGRKLKGDVEPAIDRVADHAESKLGGAFKRLAVTAGSIFAGAKLLEFGGDLLELGTQTETFRQKTATVFEDSAKDVKQWSRDNASAFGLTDDKLSGLAANFGDLLKPMGFTAKQAATMSTDVVGLSAPSQRGPGERALPLRSRRSSPRPCSASATR